MFTAFRDYVGNNFVQCDPKEQQAKLEQAFPFLLQDMEQVMGVWLVLAQGVEDQKFLGLFRFCFAAHLLHAGGICLRGPRWKRTRLLLPDGPPLSQARPKGPVGVLSLSLSLSLPPSLLYSISLS
jgi:hypothetical protein